MHSVSFYRAPALLQARGCVWLEIKEVWLHPSRGGGRRVTTECDKCRGRGKPPAQLGGEEIVPGGEDSQLGFEKGKRLAEQRQGALWAKGTACAKALRCETTSPSGNDLHP